MDALTTITALLLRYRSKLMILRRIWSYKKHLCFLLFVPKQIY